MNSSGQATPNNGGQTTVTVTALIYGTTYSASYILTVILPLSGYELDYNEGLWNDSPVVERTNCYAYILDNQIDPVNNEFGAYSIYYPLTGAHKQQPGEFYNTNLNDDEEFFSTSGYLNNPDLLVEAVEKDFQKYNQIFGTSLIFERLSSRNDVCPEGTYKVALYISSSDYHWYRQNADGTWSHKRGESNVKREDEASPAQVIYDPAMANRADYSTLVGYFAVSPWSNYYAESLALSTDSAEEKCGEVFCDANLVIQSTQVNKIELGMDISDVINLLGNSGIDIGNGTIIHEYYSDDGKNVLVFYEIDVYGVFCVTQVIKGGDKIV